MHVPDIELDGHAYDPRVLANPAEYLLFLSTTGRRPGAGGPVGLEALLQWDLELVVESRAERTHQAVTERAGGTVCSCGLVMPAGLDVVTTTGHRDLERWALAEGAYVVGEARAGAPAYGVVCRGCLACLVADDLGHARRLARRHRCAAAGRTATAQALRGHLGLG